MRRVAGPPGVPRQRPPLSAKWEIFVGRCGWSSRPEEELVARR